MYTKIKKLFGLKYLIQLRYTVSKWLLLKPGLGPWIWTLDRTLKNLDPEKPGS